MPETGVRLNKLLARRGVGSRAAVERLIADGHVTVDGEPVTIQGFRLWDRAVVEIDGRPLPPPCGFRYVAFHKPPGYVTTRRDVSGKPTICDILPPELEMLHPVGRLDRDSEGLLILTTDGELTLHLTHPGHEVEKVYHALVRGVPSEAAIRCLSEGLDLRDGPTRPARAEVLSPAEDGCTWVLIGLREGRRRQVRRMLRAVGHLVQRLVRVSIGPVALGDLAPGAWRDLMPEEVRALRRCGCTPTGPTRPRFRVQT
ncbi:MAG TPA: pseudouridine synthase [Armatimonadota bacterium]|nr:pseudouridine synthase [Armatimonadota bacterium]HQK92518.1 pseudouridine synthase [Armatimonadota bacterium]